MKKLVNKVICSALALATVFTVAGCGGIEENQYDETKLQFFVGNYNAGYGYAYIEALNKRFEEKYATTDFGNGKMGLEIIIDNSPNFNPAGIQSSKNAVYFTSGWLNYYNLIAQDVLLDITSAVRADLGEYGESGKTVESKLTAKRSDLVSQYKTAADKYYAIPLDGVGGYCNIYDVDLFENNSLYYQKGGCPSEYTRKATCASAPLDGSFSTYKYTNGITAEKSAGPDGEYGTMDDGLPATYEEFFDLCDYMVDKKTITPFTWSGAVAADYFKRFAAVNWADIEGKDGAELWKTFSGTADSLGTVNANGEFVPDATPTQITMTTDANGKVTASNAYELARQAGMYYAVSFWEQVFNGHNNDYYTTQSRSGYESQTQAQSTFLYSSYGAKPIAFLADGTWWQNEATDSFNALVQTYGEEASRENRRFGLLPAPKPTIDYVGESSSWLTGGGMVFVNGNVTGTIKDLALDYIKFQVTDTSLKEFTKIVGTVRPFEMTLSETELDGLSNFTQQLYAYAKKGAFFSTLPTSDLTLNHYEFFGDDHKFYTTLNYVSPYAAFDAGKLSGKKDVGTYFNSVKDYHKNYWNSYIINK